MLHIFIADGFEEIEALTTIDILRRCGIEVTTVSVTGTRLIRGAHGVPLMVDTVFRKGETTKSQGLILPGGMPGAKNLSLHEGLRKSLLFHNERRTLIAAICAAPMILGKRDLLVGRRATCYPGFEQELRGAIYVDSPVCEDGNIITAKGPAYATDFAFAIAARFVDSSTLAQVKTSMLLT
ncbi:DJ-1/PfpI family protein [Alloprevotella sp. OH1205_COT-284]|uniref:DJ-1 family glyoxalase III n=1 Tax=Alloprevotella sp. OH1205_COT-284 TaxID=2491043 RepID=UPI000F5F6CB3|nr:DJ-1 family glyoxalase III [Alloprevotella sp. OH1205_COT-284]RRD75675.1 DJ-1/PfpI family protein [Alloprevotella sp. OH1205_COT-284]